MDLDRHKNGCRGQQSCEGVNPLILERFILCRGARGGVGGDDFSGSRSGGLCFQSRSRFEDQSGVVEFKTGDRTEAGLP